MERWLRAVNSTARVRSTSYGNLPLEQLLNIDRHAIDRALGRGTRPSDVRIPAQQRPERAADARPSGHRRCRPRRRRAGASTSANSRARSRGATAAPSWPSRPRRASSRSGARATVTRSCGATVHEGAINCDRVAAGPGAHRHRRRGRRGAHPPARRRRAADGRPPVAARPIDVIAWSPKGDMLAVAQGRRGLHLRRRRQADHAASPPSTARSPASPGRRTAARIAVLVLRRRARDRSEDGRAPAAPGRARDRC